ncbi:MAG: UDP-N-acetylmuramate:L-alanyl-gamma-D-glutamyl-meso-diaminopimelate ligase, partial [Gammaproteobacteria bacterium]|nr:UDP-N-acetylmuramate:L-alanyl-gamma-D-glutamyl-meso-diaminopimelate ligase [Gammaproteobacteria bacterium]
TTLSGLRARVGEEQILAVIEPASHTMKKGTHEDTLLSSIAPADKTLWFEPGSVNWNMAPLNTGTSHVVNDIDTLISGVATQAREAQSPLHIVIMSNGSFQGAHQRIVEALGNI